MKLVFIKLMTSTGIKLQGTFQIGPDFETDATTGNCHNPDSNVFKSVVIADFLIISAYIRKKIIYE